MRRLFLDFETYWDAEVTLSKLSVAEYVRHPAFKVMSVSFAWDEGAPEFYYAERAVRKALNQIKDWQDVALVAHNIGFDGFILTDYFGLSPGWFMDTMGMARFNMPHAKSHSLEKCGELFNLSHRKVEGGLSNTQGLTKWDEDQLAGMRLRNIQDVLMCREMYFKLYPDTPPHVRRTISDVARISCEPVLEVDRAFLSKRLAEVRAESAGLIAKTGHTAEDLRSRETFVGLVELEGSRVDVKVSKTTQQLTYALSKKDHGVKRAAALDGRLGDLYRGRLAAMSNMFETKAVRLLAATNVRPTVAWPIQYYGATNTGRVAGGDKLNTLNYPREGGLRQALRAPAGHVLIVSDYVAVELAGAMWICQEEEVLQLLRDGVDVYCDFGSKHIFNRLITKADKLERFVSKTIVLGAQYGIGPNRAYESCLEQGVNPTRASIDAGISGYRKARSKTVKMWDSLESVVLGTGILPLPSGRMLPYPNAKQTADGISFTSKGQEQKIWGGHFLENMTQAMCADLAYDHWTKINESSGGKVVGFVYDEFIVCAPESKAEKVREKVEAIMTTPPEWAEGLPLRVEIHTGTRYEK